MLKSFFPSFQNKGILQSTKKLQEKDLTAVDEEVYSNIRIQFELSKDKELLLQQYCHRMGQTRVWQSRLRYCIVQQRLATDMGMYDMIIAKRIDGFTQNLENIRGKMSTNMRSYTTSSLLQRKINQYIVEPFYNYTLRLSFNQELRVLKLDKGEYPTTLQMFKLINLTNVLFQLKEPCKFMLSTFVNVFVIEQLIQLVYEEIAVLYELLKAGLQFRVSEFENETSSSLAELDVLLSQVRVTHRRILEFHMIFNSFSRPCSPEVPQKPRLQKIKLRQLRTTERLYEMQRLRSKSSMPSSNKLTKSKQVINKFMSRAIYQEDASNIYENSRMQQETMANKHQTTRKWVEDDSQIFQERPYRVYNEQTEGDRHHKSSSDEKQ